MFVKGDWTEGSENANPKTSRWSATTTEQHCRRASCFCCLLIAVATTSYISAAAALVFCQHRPFLLSPGHRSQDTSEKGKTEPGSLKPS